jgi:hypothetical protein
MLPCCHTLLCVLCEVDRILVQESTSACYSDERCLSEACDIAALCCISVVLKHFWLLLHFQAGASRAEVMEVLQLALRSIP